MRANQAYIYFYFYDKNTEGAHKRCNIHKTVFMKIRVYSGASRERMRFGPES